MGALHAHVETRGLRPGPACIVGRRRGPRAELVGRFGLARDVMYEESMVVGGWPRHRSGFGKKHDVSCGENTLLQIHFFVCIFFLHSTHVLLLYWVCDVVLSPISRGLPPDNPSRLLACCSKRGRHEWSRHAFISARLLLGMSSSSWNGHIQVCTARDT